MKTIAPIYKSEAVDISSDDFDFTNPVDSIYCNQAGVIVAKLRGDSASHPWTVAQGEYLLGDWETIVKSGTSLTGANDMIGLVVYEG